jgi:uncharacterized membrane protein
MRNESDIRWIVQTFRQAAWAPVLVLCLVVLAERIFDAYTRFPWADMPTHFLGGIAVTYFFWRAAANVPSVAGNIPKISHAVLALGCTASTTVLWEVFEFLSDRFLGAHMQHGLGDTSSDIFFSLAGGVTYLVLRRSFAASTRAHTRPEQPDERE